MNGERDPSWRVTEGIARACAADPADLLPLWNTVHSVATPPPAKPEAAADQYRAFLRGLHLSAAAPAPDTIREASDNALTAREITHAFHGPGVPRWPTTYRLVRALHGRPADLRPLWQTTRPLPPPQTSTIPADTFGHLVTHLPTVVARPNSTSHAWQLLTARLTILTNQRPRPTAASLQDDSVLFHHVLRYPATTIASLTGQEPATITALLAAAQRQRTPGSTAASPCRHRCTASLQRLSACPRRATSRMGFSRVYSMFAERGLTDDLTFIGSGKLALPETTDRFSTSKRFIDPSCVRSRHPARTPAGSATSGP